MPDVIAVHDKKKMIRELARIRACEDLIALDKKRAFLKARNEGMRQAEIADAFGIKQSSVSVAVKAAERVTRQKQGFSGGTPYEICQRYFTKEISKRRLIDELSKWDYTEPSETDGYDGLLVDAPGTFREVERAAMRGLIESDVYEAIAEQRNRRASS